MKQSLFKTPSAFLVLVALCATSAVLSSTSAMAQDTLADHRGDEHSEESPTDSSDDSWSRLAPETAAAAAERPPAHVTPGELRADVDRRRVRRVRFRRAAIAMAILAGVATAVVGVVKLTPEPRSSEDDDGARLLGLLLLLGG